LIYYTKKTSRTIRYGTGTPQLPVDTGLTHIPDGMCRSHSDFEKNPESNVTLLFPGSTFFYGGVSKEERDEIDFF